MLSASAESVPDRSVSCHTELSTNMPRGIYGPWSLLAATSQVVSGEVGFPAESSAGLTASS